MKKLYLLVKKGETLRVEGRIRVEVVNPVDLVRWEVEHGLQF